MNRVSGIFGWIYQLTNYSLTLKINITTAAVFVLSLVFLAFYIIRYYVLARYLRLPSTQAENTAAKSSSNQLHDDLRPEHLTQISDLQSNLSERKFLPEDIFANFLSSIKIFQFMELSVLKEFARNSQQRKLYPGEIVSTGSGRDLYLVMDGEVSVFLLPDGATEIYQAYENEYSGISSIDPDWHSSFRHEENSHLLYEVKPGGSVSSLFDVLSVYADSVGKCGSSSFSGVAQNIVQNDAASVVSGVTSSARSTIGSAAVTGSTPVTALVNNFHAAHSGGTTLPSHNLTTHPESQDHISSAAEGSVPGNSASSGPPHQMASTLEKPTVSPALPSAPSEISSTGISNAPYQSNHPPMDSRRRRKISVYARAKTEVTLLVIPEQAFKRVAQIYPSAATQMVSIILTRFQRVTFLTLYKYLGLTSELLNIEKAVNEFGPCGDFHPDIMGGDVLGKEILDESELKRLYRLPKRKLKTAGGKGSRGQSRSKKGKKLSSFPASSPLPPTTPGTPSPFDKGFEYFRFSSSSKELDAYVISDEDPESQSISTDEELIPYSLKEHQRSLSFDGDVDQDNDSDIDVRELGYLHSFKSRESSQDETRNDFSIGNHEHNNDPKKGREIREVVFESIAKIIGLNLGSNEARHGTSHNNYHSAIMSDYGLTSTLGRNKYRTSSFSRDVRKAAYPNFNNNSSHSTYFRHLSDDPASGASSPASSQASLASSQEISNEVKIMFFPQGSELIRQGERNTGLFFVIDGVLEVLMSKEDPFGYTSSSKMQFGTNKDDVQFDLDVEAQRIGTVTNGGLAGYLAALTSHPSFVTVKAATDIFVGYLSKESMDRIIEKNSSVLLTLAKRLTDNISPLVRHIDLALEWIQINAGKLLFEQGEAKSDCIYIVLNGRLRAIQESQNGEVNVYGEYGQGESVGELEVLTNGPRACTVHAVRDTELARMPKTLFNALATRHPEITFQISRIIANRSRDIQNSSQKVKQGPGNINLKTVALIPATSEVPIMEFGEKLKEALSTIEETSIVLDSASVTAALGRYAFTRLGKLKLLSWLTEQEERVRLVLYVADTGPTSAWTQRCIRQADCVLLVAVANGPTKVGEFERMVLASKTTARKELILLHSQRYIANGLTRSWLKDRKWIQGHHNLQMPLLSSARASYDARRKNPLDDLRVQLEKFAQIYVRKNRPDSMRKSGESRTDFARLARRLVGRSIGLVLGGGGARGIAHIGMISALEEAGIPIDMVGGVSIGALIGGLYSLNQDIYFTYWRAKDFSSRASSIWRQLLDLTYPLASWFSGNEFNRAIWKCFEDAEIEDSWLNYFCVTTNITHSRLEIHTSGYFWRYVRASMSLSGYLPPLCDDGDLLLDGGYLNNLPGDIIRSMGADTIIAIDVSSEEITTVSSYGDSLSGWYALFMRMLPFGKISFIPSLTEIQDRLAYVSCVKQLEGVKNMDNTSYIKPPVGEFGTLDFGKFEQIYEIGRRFGQKIVKQWTTEEKFAELKPISKPKYHTRRNSI